MSCLRMPSQRRRPEQSGPNGHLDSPNCIRWAKIKIEAEKESPSMLESIRIERCQEVERINFHHSIYQGCSSGW